MSAHLLRPVVDTGSPGAGHLGVVTPPAAGKAMTPRARAERLRRGLVNVDALIEASAVGLNAPLSVRGGEPALRARARGTLTMLLGLSDDGATSSLPGTAAALDAPGGAAAHLLRPIVVTAAPGAGDHDVGARNTARRIVHDARNAAGCSISDARSVPDAVDRGIIDARSVPSAYAFVVALKASAGRTAAAPYARSATGAGARVRGSSARRRGPARGAAS